MKKLGLKNILCLPIFLMLSVMTSGCNKEAVETPFNPTYDMVEKYTEQDVWSAYNAFNTNLLDANRKLYFRDTDRNASDANAVGAIWTQAIYWDMSMNAYIRNKNDTNKKLVEDIYQGNYDYYDHYNWDNGKVWFIYDDIMWWIVSFTRAYELLGDQKYLEYAKKGFERVWSGSKVLGDPGSYDPVEGGMRWQWNQNNPAEVGAAKMACINYPTIIAAANLYKSTNNVDYLNKAKEIYAWSRTNLFDARTGMVADSRTGKENDWTTTVYNQGTCIGAATLLYTITKDTTYLSDAKICADYVMNTMSAPLMILPYKPSEEQGIYTAIFAQYIIRLIEDGGQQQYLPWLYRVANYGWSFRDTTRNLIGKNYTVPYSSNDVISCYDASGIPALMLVLPEQE